MILLTSNYDTSDTINVTSDRVYGKKNRFAAIIRIQIKPRSPGNEVELNPTYSNSSVIRTFPLGRPLNLPLMDEFL